MGTKHFRTLADYVQHRAYVKVTCNSCGRSALYSAMALVGFFGAGYSARRLGERMRCIGWGDLDKGCGERGATVRPVLAEQRLAKVMPAPVAIEKPR